MRGGEPQHHVSSKVFCWVALDRAVELAPRLGQHGRAREWETERDRIREAILELGWSEERRAFWMEPEIAAAVLALLGDVSD